MSYCPNKNTAEYKQMSAVLGDKAATAVWFENKGYPIWQTNTGEPSPLWEAIMSHPEVTNEDTAMKVKQYMYTTKFKAIKNTLQLNEYGEPMLNTLLDHINERNAVAASIKLYQDLNLTDKKDKSKPIKWAATDANYKKVLKIAQDINKSAVAHARITKVPVNGKDYFTIMLTPKAAFTNEAGEKTAYYDAETGAITFTDKGLTTETVVHEFAHPFVDALADHNPELFNNLIDEINKDASEPQIAKIIQHVNENYAEARDEVKNKELLAYVISEYGKGNIDPTTGKNTASAIKRFFKWLQSLGKELMGQIKDGTLYVDMITPSTKYSTVADIFTAASEETGITLAANPKKGKTTPTESKEDVMAKKREALKAMAAKRKKKSGDGPANKMVQDSTAEFVDITDEAAHMSSLLPKAISTKLHDDYIKVLGGGRVVVGMFEDAMIHLTQRGPKGTAYHEGYHAVFRTLLDGKEQNKLYTEARKRYVAPTEKNLMDLELSTGISDRAELEKLYYEEHMADEFAEFMQEPTRQEYPKGIRGLFERIADWITRVFINRSKVDKLFHGIKTGKYTKRTPNITRGTAYRVHSILSADKVRRITHELASVGFEGITTIEELKANPVAIEKIEEAVIDNYMEALENDNEDLIDSLAILIDPETQSLDKFWENEIDSYLRNVIGLKKVKGQAKVTEEDVDDQLADEKETNGYGKAAYEISGKQNASAAVKFMVAMTPEVTLINPNKPVSMENITQELSTLTGLPVLANFTTTYNDVENMLAGITPHMKDGKYQEGLELMLGELRKQAKYKPGLLMLADRIANSSEEIRSQFYGAFSKQKGNFVDHLVTGSAKSGYRSILSTASYNDKAVVIRGTWATQFAQKFSHVIEKENVYNPEKIVDFIAKRNLLLNEISKATEAIESGESVNIYGYVGAFKDLLSEMGVTLSPQTLSYLIEENMDGDAITDFGYDIAFAQSLEQVYSRFVREATNGLELKEGTVYGKNNQIQDNKFFKDELAEAEAYFKKVPGENSFIGPNGNQVYSFQHNDLTSTIVQQIKAGDTTHIDNIKDSAYGKHSIWANEMSNPKTAAAALEAFNLYQYGNLTSEATAGDKGAKASELKPTETYMDNINKTMSGFYIGLAEADKSRQTYVKGPRFRKMGFEMSVNPETGKPSYTIHSKTGLRILKGYLADEISRMRVAAEVVESVPEKDWVLNYHYYSVAPGTGTMGENLDKIPGNAFESFLFPGIDLQGLGLADSNGNVLALNNDNFWEGNASLDRYITQAFGKLVEAEKAHAMKLGVIEKNEKSGSVENVLISKEHIDAYTANGVILLDTLIGDYVLNSIIGNVEFTKLFNGDPAIYKVGARGKTYSKAFKAIKAKNPGMADNVVAAEAMKVIRNAWKSMDVFGDFKKRVPAIFASGQNFRVYNAKDGTPVVRPQYTSATVSNVEVASAFFGDKDSKDGFNETAVKEVAAVTRMSVDDVKSAFAPYLEINQTDAQAWITLDAYRERMRGLGKWTEAHDVAYEEANSGKLMSPQNVKLLAQPLKTVHAELVRTKNKEMIMHYNKQSEAVLLPFMKDLGLGNLMKAMEKQGVDHVIVLDGKKAGAKGITDITDENKQVKVAKDITLNPTHLSYSNLFLQQDLPTKGVKEVLVGSQGTKNVLSVVNLTGEYFHGKTGRQIVDLFHETISRLSDKGLVDLDKSIGYNTETESYAVAEDGSVGRINTIVQQEFEGDISDNHYDAIGDINTFDALPIKNKIVNKLLALTTKKTVKLKQDGAALIQMTDMGFIGMETKVTDKVKNGIIWFKDPRERLKPMHVKDGEVKAAQVLIPHNKFVKLMEKHFDGNFKDMTHEQIQEYIASGALEGLSYRIPNQAAASNDAFEIAGVLPAEMGDTMIAFSDITTKTGSDFDIDKAFLILPHLRYNKATKKIEKIPYDINDVANLNKKELENLRLDLMRQMLLHPDAYEAVMAPLDDPWLEKYAKSLSTTKNTYAPMEFFTGRIQAQIKSTFDGAKALVGSIANHMTHHSLSKSEGLYFNGYYLGKGNIRKEETEVPVVEETVEEKTENKIDTGFKAANKEQENTIKEVQDFLKEYENGGKKFHVISGKAGTGKTTVVAEVIAQLPPKYKRVHVTALSNKATKNLYNKIFHISGTSGDSIATTVGQKMDMETGKFEKDPMDFSKPLGANMDVIFVDEASMVNEEAFELLKDLGKPLIFLGDIGQLPPIRKAGDPNEGKDSPVFEKSDSKLHERVRQGEASPILPFADHYWNNSRVDNPVQDPAPVKETVVSEEGSIVFGGRGLIKQSLELYRKAIKEGKSDLIKTVVYRNATRNAINKFIREEVLEDATQPYQEGEILMFNAPYKSLSNSQDIAYENADEIQVASVSNEVDHNGVNYHRVIDTNGVEIWIVAEESKDKFNKIIGKMFAAAAKEPKGSRARREAYQAAWSMKARYAELDYAYAITAHKSQGSTYNTVIVHEADIMSVGAIDARAKSQAMYTAITRASETAMVLTNKATDSQAVETALGYSMAAADSAPVVKREREPINRWATANPADVLNNIKEEKEERVTETALDNDKDEMGNPIGATLGAFMNAIVDAAKDPFIVDANINMYTANTAFMLARAGVHREWIVAFMQQPILKDVVAAQNQVEGRFGKRVFKGQRQLNAVEMVLDKYGVDLTVDAFLGSDKYQSLRQPGGDVTVTLDALEGAIENTALLEVPGSNQAKINQLKVLKQFLEWQGKGKDLNDLIKVSKADVEGATKSLITARLAMNLLNKVIRRNGIDGPIGNASKLLGVEADADGTLNYATGNETRMLGTYFKNSVVAAIDRFSQFFIEGSAANLKSVETIAKATGRTELLPGESAEHIAAVVSKGVYAIAASDTRAFKMEPARLKALLYGTGAQQYGAEGDISIAQRIEAAKHSEISDNLLINSLQFRAGRNGAPDKIYLPNTETLKDDKDSLTQAWNELLESDEYKQLGEDLIMYAFFTTGFSTGSGAFAEYIPSEWLKEHGFNEDIARKNQDFTDPWALEYENDKIFKNNYKDHKLVPVIDDVSTDPIRLEDAGKIIVDREWGFLVSQDAASGYSIGMGANGFIFKRFVKRRETIYNERQEPVDTKYRLYKLAGYDTNNAAVYIRTNTLGNTGGGNNVLEYIGDGNTSVIEKNNVTLPKDLQVLLDASEVLEQRAETPGEHYSMLHTPIEDATSTLEERAMYCILK